MKEKKVARILTVIMSLELMISPVAVHAQSSTSEKVLGVVQATSQVIGTVTGALSQSQSMQSTYHQALATEQLTPGPDKYFDAQKLLQIPGLGQYLHTIGYTTPAQIQSALTCSTLRTTLHEMKADVCTMGLNSSTGISPFAQMSEMQFYEKTYNDIAKQYRNFSATSNAGGQLFGVGCMKNAMNLLNGFFKYRLDELDKLTTNLEAAQNAFREASRADLDAIEEAVAVLEGGDSTMTNKVKSKNPDLFDFAKRFQSQACQSMFSGEDFNQKGRDRGLNNINQTLKTTISQKPAGSKYSGESYSNSHSTVVADIQSLADKVAKQAELNSKTILNNQSGYSTFLRTLGTSVSSSNGLHNILTADVFGDAQTRFVDSSNKYEEELQTIKSELRLDKELDFIKNPAATNAEAMIAQLENRIHTSCLSNNLSGSSSVDSVLARVFQRSASSHANKNASNFLKDKIQSIMANNQTTMEKKIEELRALENSGEDYYVKMDNAREVQRLDQNGNIVTIKREATVLQTPSAFFIDSIENCKAQYKKNKLGSTLTGSAAIQKLRNLSQNYKNLAKNAASDMKKEIIKKLTHCSGPEEANNSAIGSCTPDRFNTSAPGFCTDAAFSCATNMKTCMGESEKYVKEIKDQKTARVNNYKALLKKNKDDIVKMFDTALSQYMRDGEAIRGIFGAGFSSPSGILREVPENSRYLTDFQEATNGSVDGRLLLEDPEKFVTMFKSNIDKLKESVKKQQDQILGGEQVGRNQGLLADHIQQTDKNYEKVIRESERLANECTGKRMDAERSIAQQKAEAEKKSAELGEKRAQFCNLYSMAQYNPNGACNQDLQNFAQVVPGADYGGYMAWCAQSGNHNAENSSISEFDMCDKLRALGKEDGINACNEYEKRGVECVYPVIQNGQEVGKTENTVCIKDRSEKVRHLYKKTTGGNSATPPEAPYYCNSGNNTGNAIMKGAEAFGSALQQNLGSRAIGQ